MFHVLAVKVLTDDQSTEILQVESERHFVQVHTGNLENIHETRKRSNVSWNADNRSHTDTRK